VRRSSFSQPVQRVVPPRHCSQPTDWLFESLAFHENFSGEIQVRPLPIVPQDQKVSSANGYPRHPRPLFTGRFGIITSPAGTPSLLRCQVEKEIYFQPAPDLANAPKSIGLTLRASKASSSAPIRSGPLASSFHLEAGSESNGQLRSR